MAVGDGDGDNGVESSFSTLVAEIQQLSHRVAVLCLVPVVFVVCSCCSLVVASVVVSSWMFLVVDMLVEMFRLSNI